jgi:SRSO17 transposase
MVASNRVRWVERRTADAPAARALGTPTLSYYRCWTPGPVPLSRLIAIASARWRIEEDHQLAEQSTGLDAGQVIRWKSWHRWTVVCLLAYIYLVVAVAVQRQQEAAQIWRPG